MTSLGKKIDLELYLRNEKLVSLGLRSRLDDTYERLWELIEQRNSLLSENARLLRRVKDLEEVIARIREEVT